METSLDAGTVDFAYMLAAWALRQRRRVSPEQVEALLATELGVAGGAADLFDSASLPSDGTTRELQRVLVELVRKSLQMQEVGAWLEEGLAALVDRSKPILIVGLGPSMVLPRLLQELNDLAASPPWTSIDGDLRLVRYLRLTMALTCDDLPGIRDSVRTLVTGDNSEPDWAAALGEATFGTIIASGDMPGLTTLVERGWLAEGGRLILLGTGGLPPERSSLSETLDLEAVATFPLRVAAPPLGEDSLSISVFRVPGPIPPSQYCVLLPRDLAGDPPEPSRVMACLLSSLLAESRSSDEGDLTLHVDRTALTASWNPAFHQRLSWQDAYRRTPGVVPLTNLADSSVFADATYADKNDEISLIVPRATLEHLAVGSLVSLSYNGEDRFIVRGPRQSGEDDEEDELGPIIGEVRRWDGEYLLRAWFEGTGLTNYSARVIQLLPASATSATGTLVLRCTHPRYGDGADLVEIVDRADISANTLHLRWPNRVCRERVGEAPELLPGDVLLPIGDPSEACRVADLGHPSVPSDELALLRPHIGVDADWLLAYVLSPEFSLAPSLIRLPSPFEKGRLSRALLELRRCFMEDTPPYVDPILLADDSGGEMIPPWVYGSMLSPLFCDWRLVCTLSDWVSLKGGWVSAMRGSLAGCSLPIVGQICDVLEGVEALDELIEAAHLANVHRNRERSDLDAQFVDLSRRIGRVDHAPLRMRLHDLVTFLGYTVWRFADYSVLRHLVVTPKVSEFPSESAEDLVFTVEHNPECDMNPELLRLLDVRVHCPGMEIISEPNWVQDYLRHDDRQEVTLRARFRQAGTRRMDFSFVFREAFDSGRRYRSVASLYLEIHAPPLFRQIESEYTPSVPVNRDRLYGRQNDLDYLRMALLEGKPSHIVDLRGPWRIGKTSLLTSIVYEDALSEQIVAYMDCQGLGEPSDWALISEILGAIGRNQWIASMLGGPRGLAERVHQEAPVRGFLEALDIAVEVAGTRRILVLLDEFGLVEEGIASGRITKAAALALRHVFEHHLGLSFVLSHAVTRTHDVHSSVTHLYPMAAQRRLRPLTPEDAIRLILEPAGDSVHYPRQALDRALELTGCYPQQVQALCYNVIDTLNYHRRTYVADHVIEEAASRSIEENLHNSFSDQFNKALGSAFEQYVLAYVAGQLPEPGWVPRSVIERVLGHYQIPWEARLGRALVGLADLGALRTRGDLDHCEVTTGSGLYRMWLRQKNDEDLASLRERARAEVQ